MDRRKRLIDPLEALLKNAFRLLSPHARRNEVQLGILANAAVHSLAT